MSKTDIKPRKTHSDKYPLTLHPTDQFCKKIRGKIHYFGNDKKQALENYYEQAADLHKRGTSKINSSRNTSISNRGLFFTGSFS